MAESNSLIYAFLLGLLLPAYTVTGFDASAHTSEETRSASVNVPTGMIRSVFWSFLFGYVMICSFVLAMPDVDEGAKQGFGVPYWLMNTVPIPAFLKALLSSASWSRTSFAPCRPHIPVADDLRLRPRWRISGSKWLRHVSPTYRTPVNAIWLGRDPRLPYHALYTAVLYVLPRVARSSCTFLTPGHRGWIDSRKSRHWTKKGPFSLGGASKPFAPFLLIVGCAPDLCRCAAALTNRSAYLIVIMIVVHGRCSGSRLSVDRFAGPPMTEEAVKRRQAIILAEEKAVGAAE